jgi:hypothetical protein
MILDLSSGDIAARPIRASNVHSLVVRNRDNTPVSVFTQVTDETITHVAAGDPKFNEALAAAGFLERVDVIRTNL